MTDLPEQFVLQRPAVATVYHTKNCIAVTRAEEGSARELSDSAKEWHDLPKCRYCSGDAATAKVSGDD